MYHIHSDEMGIVLFGVFAQLWGKHIDQSIDCPWSGQETLVLSPHSLSLLHMTGLVDALVAVGEKIGAISIYHHQKILGTISLDDHYLYPYFLVIDGKEFLTILQDALLGDGQGDTSISCEVNHRYVDQLFPQGSFAIGSRASGKDIKNIVVLTQESVVSSLGKLVCQWDHQTSHLENIETYFHLLGCEGIDLKQIYFEQAGELDSSHMYLKPTGSAWGYDINVMIAQALHVAWKVCSPYPHPLVLRSFVAEWSSYRQHLIHRWEVFFEKMTGGGMVLGMIRHMMHEQVLTTRMSQDTLISLFSNISSYSSLTSLIQDHHPHFADVQLYQTMKYYLFVLREGFQSKVSYYLPPDTLLHSSQALGGGKKLCLQQLIYPHYHTIHSGLRAGDPLPPCYLVLHTNSPKRHILELLHDGRLLCLFFVGIYSVHNQEIDTQFVTLRASLEKNCDSYLVTNQYDIAKYDKDEHVLGDFDAEVHQLFSAPLSMLYLIRPDGYIAWKSMYQDHAMLISFVQQFEDEGGE